MMNFQTLQGPIARPVRMCRCSIEEQRPARWTLVGDIQPSSSAMTLSNAAKPFRRGIGIDRRGSTELRRSIEEC